MGIPGPTSFPEGAGISGPRFPLGEVGMSRGMGMCWGWVLLPITPSGSHHTYGWQVGGTHPTGTHSCD